MSETYTNQDPCLIVTPLRKKIYQVVRVLTQRLVTRDHADQLTSILADTDVDTGERLGLEPQPQPDPPEQDTQEGPSRDGVPFW